jgi:hypothetical protein
MHSQLEHVLTLSNFSRPKVDIRELSIKFGCVRLISTVQRVLSL